jgi:flagellar biosynthetic protein FlhB
MSATGAETDAEDRTQGPSKQRLQNARALGQVAHSPELTAAVGLLAATCLLACFGDDLAAALVGLVREPLLQPPDAGLVGADPAAAVAWLRHLALAVAWPLGAIVVGSATAALAAHQVQVGGLWAPGLLAPDPARLWVLGRGADAGAGLMARGIRGLWGLLKAVLVLSLAVALLRQGTPGRQELGGLEVRSLAAALAGALRHFLLTLAAATLALGLLDVFLQHRRVLARLRMTPEEHREDQRSVEGDPRLRAQRRRIARARRADPSELLAGATLVLTGHAGLTVVVGGGPPPRRASIRWMAQGPEGLRLRQAAGRARIPEVAAEALARRLAGRRAPALPLPPEDLAALAALWPPSRPDAS